MMNFFDSKKINPYITAIKSKTGEIMYLIEGTKKSVLIDTCIGIKGLKSYIDSIRNNKNPLSVLISHGHIDHAMGAPEFDDCYMNSKDISLYQSQCDISGRLEYAKMCMGKEAENLSEDEFIKAAPDYKFSELSENMKIDLGDITIEVYEAAGHTPGCMAFLIPEIKVLVIGDACNNATFLFDDICSSVTDYQNNMKKLLDKVSGKYDQVLIMHHIMDAPKDILEEMIALCDDIYAGKIDNVPFRFMDKQAYIAKEANEKMERKDGGFANLIYDKRRIE